MKGTKTRFMENMPFKKKEMQEYKLPSFPYHQNLWYSVFKNLCLSLGFCRHMSLLEPLSDNAHSVWFSFFSLPGPVPGDLIRSPRIFWSVRVFLPTSILHIFRHKFTIPEGSFFQYFNYPLLLVSADLGLVGRDFHFQSHSHLLADLLLHSLSKDR